MDMRGELISGRYRIQELVAEGGMAVVYRATDVSLGRDVAVKILRPEYAQDREFLAAFRREAHAAARLQHPHIVQILDTGMDEGRYYIVMEYMSEPDFKQILRRFGPIPLQKALEVGTRTCEALAYAHARNIVHRDIKPHNILFTREGVVKVSDFGIACPAGAPGPGREGRIVGSAAYISPEQAQGNPATPQSDLYSLGVVLYEALTGRPPFRGDTPDQIAEKHVRERPLPPRALNPEIPPSAEYVVMKALAKDMARRYQSAADMLRDLRKLAAGATLERTGVLPAPDGATALLGEGRPPETTARLQPTGPAPTARPAAAPPLRPAVREAEGPSLWVGVAVALVALVVLAAASVALWRAMYPHEAPVKVKVPRVVGKTRAEAEAVLIKQGLQLGKVEQQETDVAPPGRIISQSPEYDTFVEEHSDVNVVIAKGYETVVVPSVEGRTVPEADRMLKTAGLVRGTDVSEVSASVPEGHVIRQSIGAGTRVDEGTPVVLTVSSGPSPDQAVPPDQTPPPGGEPPPVAEPQITIAKDESFQGAPDEARINVQVIVGGRERGQWVEVISVSAAGGHKTEKTADCDPGEVVEAQVTAKGTTSIQVRINNEMVREQEFVLPPEGLTP